MRSFFWPVWSKRLSWNSAQALKDNDLDRSRQILLNDLRINRKRFEIEISIIVLMATQQPGRS